MDAFLAALAVVFVAEIGDKSQLLTLSFGARLPLRPVLSGLVCASALLMGMSVAAANLVGQLVPTRVALLVSAGLFLAFGWWTLRGHGQDGDGGRASEPAGRRRRGFLAVFAAFTAAELGVKTMLATLGLAAGAPAPATLRTGGRRGTEPVPALPPVGGVG
ncbi:MAG TPA: TMEM165/GDT1 family protein, partial [Acidimicrobiales bacterium]|nr:TMEM165/GDT1 family protein [Acidimicrobiales bacterium]